MSAASAGVPVLYAALFVALLAPGFALARVVVARWGFEGAATLTIAYALTGLAGYAAFWCYLARPELGRAVAAAWLLAAVIASVAIVRARPLGVAGAQLASTFFAGLFFLAVLYLPSTSIGAEGRFFVLRPNDNALPQIVAERMYWGENPRSLIGDWHGSDRPPLQSGMDLLVRPLLLTPPAQRAGYEIAGLIAQMAWLPAMWLLCARIRLQPRTTALALFLTFASGFALYNSVYTWPKLAAAAFCFAALVFALPPVRTSRAASLTLAGACAALALLAHGSAAFFLVPALAALVAFRRPPARAMLPGCGVALVLLLSWSAYQHFVDPPGDRLLKLHLAGVAAVDPQPAPEAIVQAYARTPAGDVVRNKIENVRTAVGAAPLIPSATADEPGDALSAWRVRERESVPAALGVVNIGWLVLPWWLLRRATPPGERRTVLALLGLALATAAFWCLLMWGPGATVTTHAAYALHLLLFVVLGAVLGALPRAARAAVAVLAAADVLVTWIAGTLPDAWRVTPSLDPVMLVLAALTAVATAAVLAKAARTAPDASALSA